MLGCRLSNADPGTRTAVLWDPVLGHRSFSFFNDLRHCVDRLFLLELKPLLLWTSSSCLPTDPLQMLGIWKAYGVFLCLLITVTKMPEKNLTRGKISLDWKFFVLVMSTQGLLHGNAVFWMGTGSSGVVLSYLNHHQTLLLFHFITRPLNHWVLLILPLFIFPCFLVVVVVCWGRCAPEHGSAHWGWKEVSNYPE